nr:reverse transcriptase domain-containing protein [Tanacetum cinerariifolium]
MPSRMRTQSVGWLVAELRRGGTGGRVGRGGGRDRGPRKEGVNRNVEGVNKGAPNFSTIIAQQLQNLLPAILAQVGNQGNVRNQNGNVVNENVQENVVRYQSRLVQRISYGFHELARLVPHLVTPESRKIERYVYGLALQIRKMVAAMEPKTMQKAVGNGY